MSKTWTDARKAAARAAYEQGDSLEEIAHAFGSSRHRVADAIRSVGGTIRGRGAPGERNGSWNGGRVVDKHGYILIAVAEHPHRSTGGYVREHRLVMEQVLGRYLRPEEVVHHLNGIHADNRPENLEVFATNASHLAHELKGRCPKWTPEGKASLLASAARRRRQGPPPSREEKNAAARRTYAARVRKRALEQSATRTPTTPDAQG